MKRFGTIILALLLVLTTIMAASCANPASEGKGTKNNAAAEETKKPTEGTTTPETTEAETTADEVTETEGESALPEDSETLNEGTDTAEVTEPNDTTGLPETEPVVTPVTEPVTSPVTEPVAPPVTEPVVQQPVPIDDAVLDQIAKDYYYYTIETYNCDPNDMVPHYVSSYFGTYDGAVVVIVKAIGLNSSPVIRTKEIAGYTFTFAGFSTLFVWKDGVFWTLEDAYGSGILTADQIGQINNVTSVHYGETEHVYTK